ALRQPLPKAERGVEEVRPAADRLVTDYLHGIPGFRRKSRVVGAIDMRRAFDLCAAHAFYAQVRRPLHVEKDHERIDTHDRAGEDEQTAPREAGGPGEIKQAEIARHGLAPPKEVCPEV